jgi:chemosensory pili system protein ChpC
VIEAVPEIRCMLIPLRQGRLLLPNATVAEVIGYRDPEPFPQAEAWLQGKVSWQQRDLPVIDFERLLGEPESAAGVRQRIVICYAFNPGSGWPLIGLVAQGIPRLLRLNREAIESVRGGPVGTSAVRMTLSVAGDDVMIPDLDYLQSRLAAT